MALKALMRGNFIVVLIPLVLCASHAVDPDVTGTTINVSTSEKTTEVQQVTTTQLPASTDISTTMKNTSTTVLLISNSTSEPTLAHTTANKSSQTNSLKPFSTLLPVIHTDLNLARKPSSIPTPKTTLISNFTTTTPSAISNTQTHVIPTAIPNAKHSDTLLNKLLPNSSVEAGTWAVNYTNTNRTCIVAHMAITIEIFQNNASNENISVPITANVTGHCNSTTVQTLILHWDGNKNETNTLKMSFTKNESTVVLNSIRITLANSSFANGTNLTFLHHHSEFKAPLQKSYKCDSNITMALNLSKPVNLSVEKVNLTAQLRLFDIRVEAFRNSTDLIFDSAVDCIDEGGTSDVVPLAVGFALATLVVIVLVAYLVGRRRSQSRGYLSM